LLVEYIQEIPYCTARRHMAVWKDQPALPVVRLTVLFPPWVRIPHARADVLDIAGGGGGTRLRLLPGRQASLVLSVR
jgi:hypothetical protein